MLRSLKAVLGYKTNALDGNLGLVHDFLIDDEAWTLRYLVVDTTGWWPGGKETLVSIAAFDGPPDWSSGRFPVLLTRDQVRKAPEIDPSQPVTRRQERKLAKYYRWPAYWLSPTTGMIMAIPVQPPVRRGRRRNGNGEARACRLRSAREIMKYHVDTLEGTVGRVSDLIFSDEDWSVRYLVVAGRPRLRGRKILVAPSWLTRVDRDQAAVATNLARRKIETGPPFDPSHPVSRKYEEKLYDYFGRPKYWAS